MPQPKPREGLRDPPRLVLVEPGGAAGLDVAEAAGAGARIAEDHDRRGALVPAVPDVRAVGLLADGIEIQAVQQALQVVVVVARRHPRLDPVGMATEGLRAVRSRPEAKGRAPTDRDRDGLSSSVAVLARARGFEHRELARHAGSLRPAAQIRSAGISKVSRRPSSIERVTKPSSPLAFADDAQYVTP